MTNPLSPDYFNLRQEQVLEGQRREAFGGGEEELTSFTDSEGVTSEGVPDGCSVKCDCFDLFEPPETVEFRGAQVEVVDPDERSRQILSEIEAVRRLRRRVDTETFEDAAMEVFDEAFNLLIARQKKYGPRNVEDQGPMGLVNRIEKDKLNRIKRAFNGQVVRGEIVLDSIDLGGEEGDTLEDALLDVANYALIILLLIRGKWGKPLAEDVEAAA